MSQLKPFKAVYYNSKKIKDPKKVFCPPYDVISTDEQDYYHRLNPHNFIHILLGKDKRNDDSRSNKYVRAKKTYQDWIKKGVLIQDDKPSIYFYRQDYRIRGERHSRLGFITLMELRDVEDSKVYPHENTHSYVINDRLRLWRNLNANLSCIFVCFSDRQKKVEKIFNKQVCRDKPLFDIEDMDQINHKIWRLSDPDLIKEINDSIKDQSLFIADGHHRYKVAMEYRRLKMKRRLGSSKHKPFNYVMTYFTNIDSKDLQILPMHRIIRRLPKKLDFLEEYFRIDKVAKKDDLIIPLTRAGQNEHAFGLYTRDGIRLLRLKNRLLIDKYIKGGSKEYRSLDATILKHFVFDRVGIKSDNIIYTKDFDEATRMVDHNEAAASFIMNPVKISQLKSIALNGERMPPKTTYFYPKVLSGLTIYKMDENK